MTEFLDWDVIAIDGMTERIEKACADVSRRHLGTVDFEDLVQEAHLILACNGPRVRAYLADEGQGWSYVSRWLWRKLGDVAKREVTIQSRQIDYDLLREE